MTAGRKFEHARGLIPKACQIAHGWKWYIQPTNWQRASMMTYVFNQVAEQAKPLRKIFVRFLEAPDRQRDFAWLCLDSVETSIGARCQGT